MFCHSSINGIGSMCLKSERVLEKIVFPDDIEIFWVLNKQRITNNGPHTIKQAQRHVINIIGVV